MPGPDGFPVSVSAPLRLSLGAATRHHPGAVR